MPCSAWPNAAPPSDDPAHDAATTAAPLPFAAAMALIAGVALLLSVIAARTTVARDVT